MCTYVQQKNHFSSKKLENFYSVDNQIKLTWRKFRELVSGFFEWKFLKLFHSPTMTFTKNFWYFCKNIFVDFYSLNRPYLTYLSPENPLRRIVYKFLGWLIFVKFPVSFRRKKKWEKKLKTDFKNWFLLLYKIFKRRVQEKGLKKKTCSEEKRPWILNKSFLPIKYTLFYR